MPKIKSRPITSERQLQPALTEEGRESRMIALAMDLSERRLMEGTASSQEITFWLNRSTEESKAKQRKLENEAALAEAKIKQIESQQHSEELYENALKAMKSYAGSVEVSEEEDE